MSEFSDILVRVGADVEPLKKGFKTAGQKAKDFSKEAANTAKVVAGVTAAAAASAAALVAMASASAQNARELKNLAGVAGVGTGEFQKMAFAAQSVGVEQDKLADIFKDSRDKVGDFLQTGAGPMADFFENIAPQIGVTADEFRNLTGPQVLQKYVNGLEKANISQNEMTFYLEALASDAALLEPLLRNGGEAFGELGQKAEEAGAVLSALDIEKLDMMQQSLDQVSEAAKVAKDSFSAEFAPVIGAVAEEFIRLRTETNNFASASGVALDFVVGSVGLVGDSVRGIQVIVKGLEVAFHGFSVGVNAALGVVMSGIDVLLNGAIDGINVLIQGINKIPGLDDIPLFAKSNTGAFLFEGMETAKNNLEQSVGELHDIMMKPLPSSKVKEFVAAAVESYETAAAETVGNAESTPLVQAVETELQTIGDMYQQFYAENGEKMKTYARESAQVQKAFSNESINAYSQMFGNISTLMDSENKKQFEIGKKAAAAQAIIDTIASAQAAYKSLAGIPVVGPALGVAAAGAATVAGMMRLQQINSTSFGSTTVPGGADAGGDVTSEAAAGQSGAGAGNLRAYSLKAA